MLAIHRICLCMTLLGVFFGFYLSQYHTDIGAGNAGAIGWLTVLQFSFLSIFMLLAWWSAPKAKTLKDVKLLLLVAVLARLICLPMQPYTSNDMDRYLFDGKIALSGYDPYQVNHNAQDLQELKDQWQPPQEHAKYPTLYPPLSLALFALAAAADVNYAPLIWKLLATGAGIITVFVLAILLQRMGLLRQLSLAALSPLLILETGIGAHVDAFSTLFVAAALYFYHAKSLRLSGVFIGLGVLIKILPIMLIIPLVCGQRKLKSSINLCSALFVTVALGYGLTLLLGLVPIGSIGTLFEKWRFGSPVFTSLEYIFSGQTLALATFTALILGVKLISYRAWKLDAVITITHPVLPLGMVLVLLLSPVVFPWYLMVLVPLVVVAPRPFLITWCCTIPLTYEVLGGFYTSGAWAPATWPLILIFFGFAGSLYFEGRNKAAWGFSTHKLYRPTDVSKNK